MGTRRDHGADTALVERSANGVGVVALVGEQVSGARRRARGHRLERRAVRRLAAGEVEDERDAVGITETMNFTGEPAPRAAKSLFASPPFAPAAETWPRTVVEFDAVARVVRHRLGQPGGDRLPDAGLAPASEALVHRDPLAVLLRHVAPRRARCADATECHSRWADCRAPAGSSARAPPATGPSADATPPRSDRLGSKTPPLQEESLNQNAIQASIIL